MDYEIRCGVDFGGENLTIDYTVVPDYSLKNFEYDNMNRLDEIFNVFETLDHLKSCLHKNKEISQDKNEDTPITFVMGDAKISYFVALPTSEEANEITFTRQDTNGNKITKLASVPANSQNLTHGILLLLSENAIEYFESIVM